MFRTVGPPEPLLALLEGEAREPELALLQPREGVEGDVLDQREGLVPAPREVPLEVLLQLRQRDPHDHAKGQPSMSPG